MEMCAIHMIWLIFLRNICITNDYLFSIPYTPKTNAIEQYFNQIKTYLKKHRNVENFNKLKISNKANY